MIFTCLIAFDSVPFRMSFFFFVGFADRRCFVHCSIFIVWNTRMIFMCIGFLRLCHTKPLILFVLYRLVCLWVHVFVSSDERKKILVILFIFVSCWLLLNWFSWYLHFCVNGRLNELIDIVPFMMDSTSFLCCIFCIIFFFCFINVLPSSFTRLGFVRFF